MIGGLKAGIEESAVGKEQTHSEISIQSRWEELLKSVSEKKNDKKKDQKKSESTEAAQKNIRILLMTDGYKQIVHKELKVSATGGLIIEKTGTREETAENEKITITKEDFGFQNQSNSKRWGRDGCQQHQERIWKSFLCRNTGSLCNIRRNSNY